MPAPKKKKLRQILAKNVRKERLKRSWSQKELGDLSVRSQKYISHIESASVAATVDTIESIAHAFRMKPEQLVSAGTSEG